MNMFSVEQHLLLQRTSVATQELKRLEEALDINTNTGQKCKELLRDLRKLDTAEPASPPRSSLALQFE